MSCSEPVFNQRTGDSTGLAIGIARVTRVPDAVIKQAAMRPGVVAVSASDHSITYNELDTRSSQLAVALVRVGVSRGSVVALCLKPSAAFVTCALAVMKAGAAYMPLDVSAPKARIELQLENAEAAVVMTTPRFRDHVASNAATVIEVTSDRRLASSPDASSFAMVSLVDSDLAYVIYTSGSTGTPKGVAVTHGNLANLVSWHLSAFDVTPADRASQVAALGFDAAVWEIWPYLACGATLCIGDEGLGRYPEALRDWLLAERVTIGFAATPIAERLLKLAWPAGTPLRLLLTGADVLHRRPRSGLPFRLINNYGPTECTVVASSGDVSPGTDDALPPIGTAIANTQVHVTAPDGSAAFAGTEGEIVIGGAGVARGYLKRPDLTADRFRPDPFSASPGARVYHTGDRGTYRADGKLAFVGRMDDQLKVRGYRIEPGEIEAVLNQHPQVRESAVVARAASDDKELLGYVAPQPGPVPTARSIRDFLVSRLPQHLIPARFVAIPSLPLNANGKVDRAALPVLGPTNLLQGETYVAPRTAAEERLAGIVAPLLGLEQVSVEDNFFMLGGHSLLGTQLIGRVREAFGIELLLRSVFEIPTIAELAAEIEALVLARIEAMDEAEAAALNRESNTGGDL